ncbi:hypothetical protein BCV69DRAFT_297749 [Microstroma glucosiphilum]|uniref:Brl1/Brr6 domain-containing protein n=1 Tax=Pseudomicrostroma glucosiphilum TaxID=1684307 RepID=A0A316UC61_9BASI|nr:hypothetical protein BCV69DRAFT_297749 [Pseudomicrostroma glucosiphilum]PWN22458.1 hypothetical protein BCV69DRAFT_297749 [Pseudomicrostroma glucosiphilum]
MDGYRRGREGPMDWEVTQDATAAPSSSRLASTHNDDAMDITFQDESIRDVSMADEDADDTQTGEIIQDGANEHLSSDAAAIEEIPRPRDEASKASSSKNASSSSALVSLFGSKSTRQRSKKSRRRRGSHSSVGSSVGDKDEGHGAAGQWPLAPVVGTVINYLVPPVPAPSAASAASSHQYTEQQLRRVSAAQKAHNTLHPREKPLLLLSYAQLAFNSSLLLLAGYVVFALVWTIRLDVVERLREIEDAYHHSIATCQRSHSLNCLIVPLPPALIAACDEWERCSHRKLTEVLGGSRLRVVIEVLSEAWEVGVGGLGWRTLGFSLLLLSVILGGANSTLNGLRMGVLRKSRRSKGRQQQEEEEEEAEEAERRRLRRERAERETMALSSGASYSSAQALPPPPSAYAAFSPHHIDPYGFQRNPPFYVMDQSASPSTMHSPPVRARGRNPLYAVPRARPQNDDASEGWVDED